MTQDNPTKQIFDKALNGKALLFEEANMLINPDLTNFDELIQVSNMITRRYFGNKIDMCAIYAAKVGRCSGDCAFCAQSIRHKSDVKPVKVRTCLQYIQRRLGCPDVAPLFQRLPGVPKIYDFGVGLRTCCRVRASVHERQRRLLHIRFALLVAASSRNNANPRQSGIVILKTGS